jgi:hypothetical protein
MADGPPSVIALARFAGLLTNRNDMAAMPKNSVRMFFLP